MEGAQPLIGLQGGLCFLTGALTAILGFLTMAQCSGGGHLSFPLLGSLHALPTTDVFQQRQQQQPRSAASNPMPLPWASVLTSTQLQRGLSYYGGGARLERVAAKLMQGQPITAVTIGGSITNGVGASNQSLTYPARFFHFLQATFPHKEHVLLNKAIAGSNADTFVSCTERLVPVGAELVVVEFLYNEQSGVPYTSSDRRVFEQLLRKLLHLPQAPAVIMMITYAWHVSKVLGGQEGLFYYAAHDHLSTMAQYYDVPTLALRNAIYSELVADAAPFKRSKVTSFKCPNPLCNVSRAEAGLKHEYVYHDIAHPNDTGYQAMAELLAGVVREAARRVVVAGGPAAVLASWDATANGAAVSSSSNGSNISSAGQHAPLLPPMIPGNADQATIMCALLEDFRSVVVAHDGFEWGAERPNKTSFVQQKWGWCGNRLGAWLELQVSTALPGSTAGAQANVLLSYLASYTNMSLARVECVSGCTCQPSTIDGFWVKPFSLTQLHHFQASQHAQCRVRLTIVERGAQDAGAAALAVAKAATPQNGGGVPMSVGFKFLANGVMVSETVPHLFIVDTQATDLVNAAAG